MEWAHEVIVVPTSGSPGGGNKPAGPLGLQAVLNEYGGDGWEAVGIAADQGEYVVIMKREVPS
jgi:hypothetical protein